MAGYVKLFGSLLASSLMGEQIQTRWVFVVMLAMADRDGLVEASLPGLAHLARVSADECRAALVVLQSPDSDSRSADHEGRRVQAVDGGWLVLNYEQYRDKATPEEQREKARMRQERKRSRDAVTPRHAPSRSVTPSEAEAEAEEEKEAAAPRARPPAVVVDAGFDAFWNAYDKKVDKPLALRSWKRISPGPDLLVTINTATAAYVSSTPDKAFRRNPSTWLNARGWENEIVVSNGHRNGRSAEATHLPNMPLGSPACSCSECLKFRAKTNGVH